MSEYTDKADNAARDGMLDEIHTMLLHLCKKKDCKMSIKWKPIESLNPVPAKPYLLWVPDFKKLDCDGGYYEDGERGCAVVGWLETAEWSIGPARWRSELGKNDDWGFSPTYLEPTMYAEINDPIHR